MGRLTGMPSVVLPRSRHFAHSELRCAHCGENRMDPMFLVLLEEVRVALGRPMILTSAYRCPEYNARISSTGAHGPHTTGQAVDVAVYGDRAVMLVWHALRAGFTGIGVKQHGPKSGRFVHLDTLSPGGRAPRPWIWSYS